MRLLFLIVSIAVVGAGAGCTAPDYGNGHLQCGPSSACPSNFYCAADQHCWRNGSGPDDTDLGAPTDLAGLILDLAGADLAGSPSLCAASSALLCEGFETSFATNGWSQQGQNGIPSIDSTRSYRGKSSLKAHLTGGAAMTSPLATITETKTFPITTGFVYARVWVYFPSPLPATFEQFLNFTDAGTTGVSVATDTGSVTLNDYAGSVYQKTMTKMPLDRWACIQFNMTQGTTTGTIAISVDGKNAGGLPPVGVTTTAVGLILGLDFDSNSAAIPAYDAWFDELIVDNKPIACDD
jgi:hypothetical protein